MYALEANPNVVKQHRDYQASLFVNRQDEIEAIQKKIRLVQSEQTVLDSIINYWGVGGIGKTWILRHLSNKFEYHVTSQEKYPTFTVLFDFQKEYGANKLLENFTRELASQILSQLASASLPISIRQNLEELLRSGNIEDLAETILGISKFFTPLILLDHTEQVSAETWEQIEKLFFEPVVSTGKALVVVAGRRQVPRWRRFEVRRRVVEPDKSLVGPFDKQGIVKQLEKLNYSIPADLLYTYTAGNPQFVDAFAQHIQAWKEKTKASVIDNKWVSQHNKSFLDVLHLTEKELTKDVPNRLKQPLLSVAPLRFYRLEAMRFMLARQNQNFRSEPDSLYLQYVRDLDQETEIVWWDRSRRAYVTSQVVRKLINRAKFLESHTDYISSHNHALEMYWQWAKEAPKTSDEFIIEILFHHASICEAQKDNRCLQQETEKALEFARDSLSAERILVLQKQIEGDNELLEMYSEELREELLGGVERLLKSRVE